MPTSLTGSRVRDTYGQLLHLDGGVAATEKAVRTGDGVATALNVGNTSVSVGNVRLTGNSIAPIVVGGGLTITATGGSITGITDLAVADGGTGASDPATARVNLGLAIGANVQAYDVTLQSLSALGTAADKYAYTTGVDTWAEGAITAAGRAILDDADAAAQRTALGLGTMATQNIGASGTFLSGDTVPKTITVTNGIVTSIV